MILLNLNKLARGMIINSPTVYSLKKVFSLFKQILGMYTGHKLGDTRYELESATNNIRMSGLSFRKQNDNSNVQKYIIKKYQVSCSQRMIKLTHQFQAEWIGAY
jgi:hypothetical protein